MKYSAVKVEVKATRKSYRKLGIDPPCKMDPNCKVSLGCIHCNFNSFGCGACVNHHKLTFGERAEFNRIFLGDCHKCGGSGCRYCFKRAVRAYQEEKKMENEEPLEPECNQFVDGLDVECYGCYSV